MDKIDFDNKYINYFTNFHIISAKNEVYNINNFINNQIGYKNLKELPIRPQKNNKKYNNLYFDKLKYNNDLVQYKENLKKVNKLNEIIKNYNNKS
jgi:hypothetical protein